MATLVALLSCLMTATTTHSHGMRTAYLELMDSGGEEIVLQWKTTVADRGLVPRIDGCTAIPDSVTAAGPISQVASLRCPGGLGGRTITIDGLGPIVTEAVIRVAGVDGVVRSHVATPGAASWIVPRHTTWLDVTRQYVILGVEHILGGADHLLFLLALVLYVRRPRAILLTESAFTLSHSLSFSATALGWIRVSAPAAEACIALSLILVALDVGDPRGEGTASRQGPVMALVFGLVHGLGFAGALGEIGLPDEAIASALVGFGLGVEVGQIAFLLVVMAALALVPRVSWQPRVALVGSYLVGVMGSWWLFERLWMVMHTVGRSSS